VKKKLIRALGALFVLLIVVVGGCVGYIKSNAEPVFEYPATGITASDDPEIIKRGEYLFHGPMHCTACHVDDWRTMLEAPAGKHLDPKGGQVWEMGPMGTMRSANLTSDDETGLGKKSDEHIAKVLKYGVGEDGKLRVFMAIAVPSVSDDDIRAVLSYVRTIPAQKNAVLPDEFGIAGEALIAFDKFGPKKQQAPAFAPPGEAPNAARGEYLAKGPAMCMTCHSPHDFMDNMKLHGPVGSGCYAPEPGKDAPELEVCAPNLTPDPKTGHIVSWDEAKFVERLKGGFATPATVMPWGNFAAMTDHDLKSIYLYLKSLPPAERDVGPPIREKGSWSPPE
jgi:mono/diheme cytochrome c family protein